MTTTVQVNEETLEILRQIKERRGFASYDEVIKLLIKEAIKPGRSMYGALGRKSMAQILEGLRDEGDRI
nr:hypothetical protein [Candidatus Njordarchaeota archaeon]